MRRHDLRFASVLFLSTILALSGCGGSSHSNDGITLRVKPNSLFTSELSLPPSEHPASGSNPHYLTPRECVNNFPESRCRVLYHDLATVRCHVRSEGGLTELTTKSLSSRESYDWTSIDSGCISSIVCAAIHVHPNGDLPTYDLREVSSSLNVPLAEECVTFGSTIDCRTDPVDCDEDGFDCSYTLSCTHRRA
ncbi:MAG: hypothetical protein KDD64_05025 [Bdellovibrionales bacterium]|nr:hypothetical protein [Bdellovibrionales bacterium]